MILERIVFCDFDGTITARETFVAVLKRFAPELAAALIPKMYALELTLREGVQQLLESMPSSAYAEIIEFAASQPLRAGLPEFLDFLDDRAVPFVVITGGLQGIVEAAIPALLPQIHAVHGVEINAEGPYLQVRSPALGDSELVSKVDIMQRYPARQTIAVGDSVTDLKMALAGDVVFARDRLAEYLGDRDVPYYPWHDFHDVRETLATLWQ
ncbi:HAD-IB family phosphatase [Altericista sp. CCNU0014]|uniref:HAD-IB family phosphatase n=1 Tax=Altericista sp. CCNU0014 TaxID=3082949 RepID=UPI00384C24CC